MFLTLDITKVLSGLSVWNDLNEDERVGSSRFLTFSVEADETEHLDLKTGEIFQSRVRAKNYRQEDKQITASLILRECSDLDNDGVRSENKLSYVEASEGGSDGVRKASKSHLCFFYYFAEKEFSLLYSSIIAGHVPKSATVEFAYGIYDKYGLKYWLDGSGKHWDNDEGYIPFKRLSFGFHHYDKNDEGVTI